MKSALICILLAQTGICFAKKNVLFFMVDDLRPQLSPYTGSYFPSSVSPPMTTPNILGLANKSLLLQRAYVQQAMCGPSRASLLTGRRPDTTHVYDLKSDFRVVGGDFTTLPQYFKNNGYRSIGMGKIFHPGSADGDDPISWSEYFQGVANHEDKTRSWKAIEEVSLNRRPLRDRQVADKAIEKIRELATGSENFFLAVGFHKPHEPFVFPETYLQYYPEDDIILPSNDMAPVNMPEVAWSPYNGLREYDDIASTNATGEIGTVLPDDKVKELRRAYYAAVSWIDSLVGEILDELERSGLSNNTVISLISDHGYQLGEHGEWGKRTNFELSTHAPMMIHIPGMTDSGIQSDQLVEFVDLFPTLVEAAELDTISQCPEDSSNVLTCHEGTSLIPLVNNPTIALKKAAFSQAESPYPGSGRVMGYTMRTDQYRYTEWATFRYSPYYVANWRADLSGVELYDHSIDPDENFNLADEEAYKTIREDLSTKLRTGWRGALEGTSEKRFLERLISMLLHDK